MINPRSSPSNPVVRRAQARKWLFRSLPLLVVLLGIGITVFAYVQREQAIHSLGRTRFDREIERATTAIIARYNTYQDLLASTRSLFTANDSVNRVQWQKYINNLPLKDRYPGVVGIGFAAVVPNSSLAAFEGSLRSEGFPGYEVRPKASRETYYPIRYIEPLEPNIEQLGFDLAADPIQRAAAENARDSGKATLTPKLTLAQARPDDPGFLLILPVYRSGASVNTVETRRAALVGWVIAPILAEEMFAGILGTSSPETDLEIFDGSEIGATHLLFDSDASGGNRVPADIKPFFPTETYPLPIGERGWTLAFSTLPPFDRALDINSKYLASGAVGVVSLLVFALTLVMLNTTNLAQRQADRMTVELRESESRLRRQNQFLDALRATRLGLLSQTDLNATLQDIVARAAELAGTPHGYLFQMEPSGEEMVMKAGIGFFAQRIGDRIERGQSVAGVVWQEGEPLVVNDYPRWSGRVPNPLFDRLQALAGVPLKSGDRVIGVIGLGQLRNEGAPFAEEDITRLSQIGELASLALANADLFNQVQEANVVLEQRVAERTAQLRESAVYLSALNDTTLGLISRTDLEELLAEIIARAGRLVGSEHGYIYLLEPDEQEMQMRLGTGAQVELTGNRIKPGDGVAGRVWQSGKPLIVNDYVNWGGRLRAATPLRAVAGVPLISADKVVGIIGLAYIEEGRQFGDREIDVLSRFAQLASIALENARLLEQTQTALSESQQRSHQLAALNQIGQSLSRLAEPTEILDMVFAQIAQILSNRNFYVALYDEQNDFISFPIYTINGIRMTRQGRKARNGATEYVIRNPKPLFINSNAREELIKLGIQPGGLAGPVAQSWLGVPLLAGDKAIGVMCLQDYERAEAFSATDQELLSTVAGQTAIALENARLFKQTEDQVQELATINSLSQALSAELDANAIIKLVGDRLQTLFDASIYSLALYDSAQDMIHFAYFVEDNQFAHLPPLPLGGMIASSVVRTRQPLLINRTMEQANESGAPLRSYLAVPMVSGNNVLGMLSVQNNEREGAYTERDIRLLATIAANTGVALQNARLFDQEQQRARREQALREVTTRVRQSVDVNTIMRTAAQEVGRALGRKTFIKLGNGDPAQK